MLSKKWLGQVAAASLLTSPVSWAASPEEILKTPLIVGASVSAGSNGVASPGKNLALRYTKAPMIRTEAANGRTGRDTVKRLRDKDIQGRSLLIGVDLFFWDTARSTPQESIPALHRVLQLAQQAQVPMVMGDIPALFPPPAQPHLSRMNREIHQACSASPRCALLPLHAIHQKAVQDGYILYRGVRYQPHELLPDGLHLSPLASDFLADQIAAVLKSKDYFKDQ